MKRRIKQFAVVCFVAAAISGIGNVFVHADYNGVPDKVTINGSKRSVVQGKKFEVKEMRLHQIITSLLEQDMYKFSWHFLPIRL